MMPFETHYSNICALRRIIILLIASTFSFASNNAFSATPADKVKAAYIYQLSQFSTWPSQPSTVNNSLTICVLGKDPISEKLAPLDQYRNREQLIKINNPKKLNETINCQILYIAKTKQHRMKEILNFLYDKPILTVSSVPNFTAKGGIIGFVIIDNKVRLEINRAAAQRAGIKLSAKLFEIASTIRNELPKKEQP